MKTYYTLGFLFTHDFTDVVLTEKERPLWQKGKLNGIGGHIEEGETPDECIIREFSEEVSCNQIPVWSGFAMIRGKDFEVFCFAARADKGLKVEAKTDEKIEVIVLNNLHRHNCIENIGWLTGLAKEHLIDGRPLYAYIDYE